MAHRMIMNQRQPLLFPLFFPLVLLFSAEVWRFWVVMFFLGLLKEGGALRR